MEVLLNESATVTLNGAGAGTAKVGPISARETWSPGNVHVSASSHTNEAVCTIYSGDSAIQRNYVDSTFSGSSGDATDQISSSTVKCGQHVWAVWTGGDPGATASVTVTGKKDI